jgi:tRNA U34 5-methylaminomethyl-2-thiouridine-forming methyltransferase MnmC
MKSAIAQVLPDSRHRNYFFHIKQKCYNKNLKVFAKNNGLLEMFEDTVNFSVTEEEFETLWKK